MKSSIKSILNNRAKLGRLLVYMVALVPLFYKLLSPFFILAGLGAYTIYITGIVLWIGVLLSINDYLSSIRVVDVGFFFMLIMIPALSSFIVPSSELFVKDNLLDYSLFVVPYFFIGLVMCYERDSDVIRLVAYISLIVLLFWQIVRVLRLVEVSETEDGFLGEQMEQGYMLLFPSCYFFVETLRTYRLWDILSAIVAAILLFFMGARGPALLLVLFYVNYLVFFQKFEKNNLFKKIVLAILFVLIAFYYQQILEALMPLAYRLGFNTRVFDSFIYGNMVNIEESSGRDDIYAAIIRALNSNQGIWGFGWGGDRSITPDGLWAHNFELEILIQFGIIFGSIMIVSLLILIIRCISRNRPIEAKSFWFILFFLGLMELQLSYTYIRHPLFFLFLGYCISFVSPSKQIGLNTNCK